VLRLRHEAGKFVGVGSIAYAVDLVLFNVAHYAWGMGAILATVVSTTLSASVAFVGNRYWTWRDRPRGGLHREYFWYFLFNAVGLGINLIWVALYNWLNLRWPSVFDNWVALNLFAKVIGVGTASMFRFYSYRTWVFADKPSARAGRDVTG
jgi:putative flippase GtrA